MTEIQDFEFWFNQTHEHGDVHDYGIDYCHNKIIKQIIFNLQLPKGKIIMLGSHRCVGLDILCHKYGNDRVIGFDLYNPTNHPCVKTGNIINLTEQINSALIINDLGSFKLTPKSKIYAQEWASKNTVKGGYVLCTTNNNSANYDIEGHMKDQGFELIRLNNFITEGIDKWALDAYCLYKKL